MSLLGLPRLTFVQTLDLLGLGCEAKKVSYVCPREGLSGRRN